MLPLKELYRNDFPLDLVFPEIEVVRYEGVSNNLPKPVSGTCQQRCDRCGNFYDISQQSEPEKCIYHPNKAHVDLSFGNQMGEKTRIHSCCGRAFGSLGCARGPHVFSISRFVDLKKKYVFISSHPFPGDFEVDQLDSLKCLALDCEMVGDRANLTKFLEDLALTIRIFHNFTQVYTTEGSEVARVTLIDACGNSILDEFVKPKHPILDYSTSFSGLTQEILAPVTATLEDIRRKLLSYIHQETILIGHSLDNDLKALRVSVCLLGYLLNFHHSVLTIFLHFSFPTFPNPGYP